MFDNLNQFDTSAANAGAKMELRDAADAPVLKADGHPMTISLLGKDSDAFIKQDNAATNRRLAQGSRIKLTAEALKADAISLLARCTTVWLRAAPEEHMGRVVAQGDMRPMVASKEAMDDLKRILDGRAAFYSKAEITVDTSGQTPEQSLQALSASVRKAMARAA